MVLQTQKQKYFIQTITYLMPVYTYYTSPYDKPLILSVDGVGEWETTTLWYGEGNKIARYNK